MYISRNKCELIAEYCITGVKQEYDRYAQATVKGIVTTKINMLYNHLQKTYRLSVEDFEVLAQLFYRLLNRDDILENNFFILSAIAEKELEQIEKNREMEEFNYV